MIDIPPNVADLRLDPLATHQRHLEREVGEASQALFDYLGLDPRKSGSVPIALTLQVLIIRLCHKVAVLETQLEELRNEVRTKKD